MWGSRFRDDSYFEKKKIRVLLPHEHLLKKAGMTILIAKKSVFQSSITRDNNNNQRVNQEDIMIMYVCTPKRAPKCRNQTLIKPQGGIDKTTVIVIS